MSGGEYDWRRGRPDPARAEVVGSLLRPPELLAAVESAPTPFTDELAPAELDVRDRGRHGRPALDEGDRRDQPHRLLDRVPDELGPCLHGLQLVGVLKQEQDGVGHHRLDRLDRPEEDH